MDVKKSCDISSIRIDLSEDELHDACRVYNTIRTITRAGFDAEIKQVKGTLKILAVKKSIAKEIKI
ncbi:MAG: hypothetical protein PHY15_01055 [Eubacteriales bacterium]|nr:hypothetical protein [Eubacteriales bacterium]MDD4474355.1 hypothetical protein [Eubacteriales bacterium]